MRRRRDGAHSARFLALTFGTLAVCGSLATAAVGRTQGPAVAPPAGQAAPARLVGLYAARFTLNDAQTAGTWHLRIGPGHHLKVWNPEDPVANSRSFEAGPVSFRRDRMVFAKLTGEGVCTVGATYRWTYRNALLRFRLVGRDGCQPRVITFTPHAWHRSS